MLSKSGVTFSPTDRTQLAFSLCGARIYNEHADAPHALGLLRQPRERPRRRHRAVQASSRETIASSQEREWLSWTLPGARRSSLVAAHGVCRDRSRRSAFRLGRDLARRGGRLFPFWRVEGPLDLDDVVLVEAMHLDDGARRI